MLQKSYQDLFYLGVVGQGYCLVVYFLESSTFSKLHTFYISRYVRSATLGHHLLG